VMRDKNRRFGILSSARERRDGFLPILSVLAQNLPKFLPKIAPFLHELPSNSIGQLSV
jgi:hypothetical protein